MAEVSIVGGVSLNQFLLFFFTVLFSIIIGWTINLILVKILKRRTRPVVYKSISKIVMYGIVLGAIFYGLNKIINFNLGAGLATLGILGTILLLPLIPLLQNISAGVLLSLERPFREDDIIEYNGELCIVKDLRLRSIKLRTLSGKIMYVPNTIFFSSSPVVNYSQGEFIRTELNLDITLDSDKEKAQKIIENVCLKNSLILPNIPKKEINALHKFINIPKNFFVTPKNIEHLSPKVLVKNITKDKCSLLVWFWTWDVTQKEQVISTFLTSVQEEFKKENITLG